MEITTPIVMFNELESLCESIRSAASNAGLTVFEGHPDLDRIPTVRWQGDWPAFIDLAAKANATLLYLQVLRYDPDTLIDGIVDDPADAPHDDGDRDDYPSEGDAESQDWLRDRLHEAIAAWNVYRGSQASVDCVWVKDGIAHWWRDVASWAMEYHDAIQAVLDETEKAGQRDRVSRSREAADKLHTYANILAIHPRFPEAKSEEKREFMAQQMFGDDLRKEPPAYQLLPHLIARRALLIYWWDIEPQERATIDERVRQLRESGESIKNIAATLHISDAKVRTALKSDH